MFLLKEDDREGISDDAPDDDDALDGADVSCFEDKSDCQRDFGLSDGFVAPYLAKQLDVGDVQIYYEVLDRAPAIVYLHGMTANHTIFNRQREHFTSRGYGSLAPDQRGDGHSPHVPREDAYALEHHTSDLERIIEHERIPHATLVGHSMGSMVAQNYAARNPDKVDGLVLISSSYDFGKTFGRSRARRTLLQVRSLLTEKLLRLRDLGRQLADERRHYFDFSTDEFRSVGDLRFLRAIYSRSTPGHVNAMLALTNKVLSWNTEDIAPRIKAPTLIVHGEQDSWVPSRTAHELRELITSTVGVVMVPEATHSIPFQQPEATIKAMEPFLQEIYGRIPTPASATAR